MSENVLSIRDLTVRYRGKSGYLCAVQQASFDVGKAAVFGLVGESGCGKSTLGSAIIRLLPNNGEIAGGKVLLEGDDILALSENTMRQDIRGNKITMVTQDPQHALNPVFKVGTQLHDVLKFHASSETGKKRSRLEREETITRILAQMGIPDPADRIDEYPHQFSGGMKQRVMLAMAFITNPLVMIADEPTTALDPTIEAQILEILQQNIEAYSTSVLYITHDLGVINKIADIVTVMYAGSIVEQAATEELFENPLHPYTEAMLNCLQSESSPGEELQTIPGSVPKLDNPPSGCKFHPRCRFREQVCSEVKPGLVTISSNHKVACHLQVGEGDSE